MTYKGIFIEQELREVNQHLLNTGHCASTLPVSGLIISIITTPGGSYYYYSHFTGKKQKGRITCLTSHNTASWQQSCDLTQDPFDS